MENEDNDNNEGEKGKEQEEERKVNDDDVKGRELILAVQRKIEGH